MALVGVLAGGMSKLGWSVPDGDGRSARFRLQDATASLFRKYLTDPFTVRVAGEGRVRLVLAKVTDGPATRNVEQFSLIFHGPAGTAIPDGTHTFQHPEIGTFDLFIIAIGIPNDRRVAYQACFGRHVTSATSAVL